MGRWLDGFSMLLSIPLAVWIMVRIDRHVYDKHYARILHETRDDPEDRKLALAMLGKRP